MALQVSLEFSQKEQDKVKGCVEHVEVDAVANKNRIIKQQQALEPAFLRGERRVWWKLQRKSGQDYRREAKHSWHIEY